MKPKSCDCCRDQNVDKASIMLGPLKMEVEKSFCDDTPNEITVVVPRVEIRETIRDDEIIREYIYSSVTIVDSPIREPVDSVGNCRNPQSNTGVILEKIKDISE